MNQNEEYTFVLLVEVSLAFLVFLGEKWHGAIASIEKQNVPRKATSLKPALLSCFSIKFYHGLLCPYLVFKSVRKTGEMMALIFSEVESSSLGFEGSTKKFPFYLPRIRTN